MFLLTDTLIKQAFFMLFSIDNLWQGHFHSKFVKYAQKFIEQNFRIEVFFV